MFSGYLALTVAALFTGAAFYINFAEQPARLALDDRALLAQWKLSYKRGFVMQASLAVVGALLAFATWATTGDLRWLLAGAVLLANWPYTLIGIMPTNTRLMETALDDAGPTTRALIEKWNGLHVRRTGLGAVATVLFLWALT